jgi:hypothetical protein
MTHVMHPYELTPDQLGLRLDEMVRVTFTDLTSQFMLLPRGEGFIRYDKWLVAYETLRHATSGFNNVTTAACWNALRKNALSLVVLRTVLGVSGPEWQDLTAEECPQVSISTNWTRTLDGRVRRDPDYFTTGAGHTALNVERTTALLDAACAVLTKGAPVAPDGLIHRLEKVDTKEGLASIRHVATHHVPYAVLLYERYLGRPFASHRDSVSELVGDVMESAIEEQLAHHGVPFRKTRRAERIPGFEQAPDFFIPDEFSPSVIIEAKITGDDGTARDKVARIKVLAAMRDKRERAGKPSFEVVACIDGRGFGVRTQDMRDLLTYTRGKVFTANSLGDLVANTRIIDFVP